MTTTPFTPSESPVSVSRGRPLAPAQVPLWLSQRLNPAAPVQNMALVTWIDGPVDAERLATAFEETVAATDVLRTRVVETAGNPKALVDAEPLRSPIVELDRSQVEGWARDRVATPLDLSVRGYDSVVIRHPDQTVSWYLCLHHVITDATASSLVFADTARRYHGESVAPASFYQWVTSALTERGQATGNDRAIEYWAKRQPAQTVDRLYQPVRQRTPEASRLPVSLGDDLLDELHRALGQDYRMLSPDLAWSTLLVTATAAFLHQLTGRNSLTIGLPVHNRSDAAARDLIGPLMEVFPVDVTIEPGDTFRDLHRRVGRSVMSTLAAARPGTAPAADHAAVVNVIARAGLGRFGEHETETRWVHSGAIDANHLLRVQLTAYTPDDSTSGNGSGGTSSGRTGSGGSPQPSAVELAIDINHGGANGDHRGRAPHHFRRLLAAMVTDPDRSIAQSLLGPDEQLTLERWETTPDLDDPVVDVVTWLAESLAGRSEVVLRQGGQTWTGAELWSEVTRVAGWLQDQGIERGDRVGVELARSADAVVAILAVLVAGASFIPLELTQPERRRRSLAERAGCRLVITNLPDRQSSPGPAEARSFEPPPLAHEAYLLFTSGSTGEPKGVPITHLGLARYLQFAAANYVTPGERPVVALFSALGFDLTITSLFLPLLVGGEQVVIEAEGPAALAAIAEDSTITWCKATPSHLEILIRLLPDDHQLATLVVGGEAFGSGLARRLLDRRSQLAIFNEYGPTEAVVGCMIHQVDPDRVDDHPEVPIGVPAPGVTLRVVGPGLERVPLGVAGELLIGHSGLTGGYLAPDGTEVSDLDDRFVVLDSDGAGGPGGRFYRSGDLVRLVDEQTLVYLGRIDEQVKVGGIRLEPTEVEEALVEHPALAAAAVRLWSPASQPETGQPEQTQPEQTQPEQTQNCARCGLASTIPGTVFDESGVCGMCHAYDRVAPQTSTWFRTVDDLTAKRDEARSRRTGRHDCLHLLSGGKDSTYALYRLVELGFEPYALTLDNGFISEEAKDNVRRTVDHLGIDHEFATTEAMNAIFRDSLERHSNVCHGCYKTIYTLATNRAVDLGIPMIVTGLSRGQLFETRLIPQQFEAGRFDPEAIDRAVIEARKVYHRVDDGPNRLLDTAVFADDQVFEQIDYLDFYRYIDVELSEMLGFLDDEAPWVRPSDTGRSTNCLINAAGIHTHLTEQGYHNYAEPYAWDVRLGHKTRDEALAELDDQLDLVEVEAMLKTVGYQPKPAEILTAWIEPVTSPGPNGTANGDGGGVPTPAELRSMLSEVLPAHAIPAAFVTVDRLPLSTNGKLDAAALPAPERVHRSAGLHVEPSSQTERIIIQIWERLLAVEPIGVTDDFFALGGDSLRALEMMVLLSDTVGRALGEELAFTHSTPQALARAVEGAGPLDPAAGPLRAQPDRSPDWSTDDPPPLSPGQQALLFEQSLRPDQPMYNIGRVYEIQPGPEGPLGPGPRAELADAIVAVAARHVPFRWNYTKPRLELEPDQAITIEIGSETIDRERFEAEARRRHRLPVDLADGPLLVGWIQPLDDGTTAVLLICHHVSSDAESFDRFWAQVDAQFQGDPHDPGPVDYPTFIGWQQDGIGSDTVEYWSRPPVAGPARLQIAAPSTAEADGFVTKRASIAAADLHRRAGATTFAAATSALAATLRRYSDGDEVALAMVTSTREAMADSLVGYFLNALPLQLTCGLDTTLGQLTEATTRAVASNLANRSYPYARIVDDRRQAGLAPPERLIMVVHEELDTTSLDGFDVNQNVLSPDAAVADATLWLQARDGALHLGMEYRGSFLDRARAEQLLADIDLVLAQVANAPQTAVGQLALGSVGEGLLSGERLAVEAQTVLDLIAEATNASTLSTTHPAVICDGEQLTWAELDTLSAALAHQLVDQGVRPGDRVVVHLPRSVGLVVAVLGALRAGATYVPVDPTYPAERIAAIVEAADAPVTLVSAETDQADRADQTDQTDAEPQAVLVVDLDRLRKRPVVDGRALPTIDGDQVAYVIFTSGSTGRPRGVPVTHRQLAASTLARRQVYPDPVDRFLLLSSVAFDSSVVGLFWSLIDGGTIVVPTDRQSRDPDAVVELIERGAISHLLCVPTLYAALLERGADQDHWPGQVIVAGEACPPKLTTDHHRLRPRSALTNEYGPTEATVWATAHHCRPGEDPVPIGRPIPGASVAVIDVEGRHQPRGVVGELIIGGCGVVAGYLDDPMSTAERFIVGPDGGRWFRTGDRATIDGHSGAETVYFLGRIDDQLNVGGVRAEPEDIERALSADESVGAVVVTALDPRPLDELLAIAEPDMVRRQLRGAADDDEPGLALLRQLRTGPNASPKLVAFIEPRAGTTVDLGGVREAAKNLPTGLRPTRFQVVEPLPRTPNGKLDREAVVTLPITSGTGPAAALSSAASHSGERGPFDDLVDRLTVAFARTLGLDRIGPDDSFFDLGGQSLSAIELLADIEANHGISLTATTLYDHPSPRALAVLVAANRSLTDQYQYLVPIQPEGSRPPLIGVHVLGVNASFYHPMATHLGPDQPIWGLGLPTATPDTSGPTDVVEIAARYVAELERRVPAGPVALAAVSLAGTVAFEMAKQLRANGRQVNLIALFDAVGPRAADDMPTKFDRIRSHSRELIARPLPYVVARWKQVGDRIERRTERIRVAVRRRLGLSVSDNLRIREFVEANWAAQHEYHFEPYDGAVVVYKAAADPITRQMAQTPMGWEGTAVGPFEVKLVPGQHLTMLAEPHVPHLAASLADDLARFDVGPDQAGPTVPAQR